MVRDALGGLRPGGGAGVDERSTRVLPLLVGALGELLLFFGYLTLPVGMGVGMIWFGVMSWPSVDLLSGFGWAETGVIIGKVLLPVVTGAGVIVLLLKPFVAEKAAVEVSCGLDLDKEKTLRRFLKEMCSDLKVDFPERVSVTCEPTLVARRASERSWRQGNGFELVLGLPLLVGMELRGFGGLMAREMGFYSGGFWKYVERALRGVHCWLARAVCAQDKWDRRIAAAREAGEEGRFPFLAGCAEALVWLARRPLWMWLHGSRLMCAGVLRRTEAEGDERLAAFSGSSWLEAVVMRQRELEEGYQVARKQCFEAGTTEDLPRDFPALAVLRANLLPEDHRSAAWQGLGDYRAAHPDTLEYSLNERKEWAGEGREMGRCIGAARANTLLEDYGRVSEETSHEFYRAVMELELDGKGGGPLGPGPSTRMDKATQVGACGLSLFGRETCLQLPIHLNEEPMDYLSMATPLLMEKFARERAQLREETIVYRESARRAMQAEMGGFAGLQADMFLESGIEIRAEEFGLKEASREATREMVEESAYRYGLTETETQRFFGLVRDMVQSTVSLVARNDFCGGDAQRSMAAVQEMQSLMGILMSFGTMRSQMGGLRRHLSMLDGLFTAVQRMETSAASPSRCLSRLRAEAEGVATLKRTILAKFDEMASPFPGSEGEPVSVGDYLRQGAGLGVEMSSGEVRDDFAFASEQYRTGYGLGESLTDFYFRVVERVAFYVESVDWVVQRREKAAS